jgi:hypothetical protein
MIKHVRVTAESYVTLAIVETNVLTSRIMSINLTAHHLSIYWEVFTDEPDKEAF